MNNRETREMVELWVKSEKSKLLEQFPNDLAAAYASLAGRLESKLVYLAMGGSAREIALEMIEDDLKEAV